MVLTPSIFYTLVRYCVYPLFGGFETYSAINSGWIGEGWIILVFL